MKIVNIGFGSMVAAGRVLAIVAPDSAPIKRVIQEARDRGMLIDASYGRKTKAVLLMDTDHVILSGIPTETLYARWMDRPEEEIQDLKEQIKGLTEEIGTLRKEVVLCDGIAARSKVIEEKFKMVREEKEKKEEQSHEHIRRSR